RDTSAEPDRPGLGRLESGREADMRTARPLVWLSASALVLGSAAIASAVILITVLTMLTLFAIVGLTFETYADVHVVADPPDAAAACDIGIEILDEHGQVLDTRQARVPAGEMVALQYRSQASPGGTDPIRASVKSRTVTRHPVLPGPCPILASVQVVEAGSGKTVAVIMPVTQRILREVVPAP